VSPLLSNFLSRNDCSEPDPPVRPSCSFGIVSEMREPKLYTRAMLLAQSVITGVLIVRSQSDRLLRRSLSDRVLSLLQVIGVLVYVFVGQYVSSPALGSAGPLMKKVRSFSRSPMGARTPIRAFG